jgi:hypothetical protein
MPWSAHQVRTRRSNVRLLQLALNSAGHVAFGAHVAGGRATEGIFLAGADGLQAVLDVLYFWNGRRLQRLAAEDDRLLRIGGTMDKIGEPISIDGDIDLRGFFGVDDRIRAGFNAVRVHVSLGGPEHATRYEELAAVVDDHCPVLDLFRNPVPVERKLVSAA